MPEAGPVHSTPVESSSRQFTSSEGRPALLRKVVQRPPDHLLNPPGVANHIVPSALSRMAETVLDASPSASVKFVKRPSRSLLTPALSVPAQTVPSRARYTEETLSCASPSACVHVFAASFAPLKARRVNPPRCLPTHSSPGPPSSAYTRSSFSPSAATWPCCESFDHQ